MEIKPKHNRIYSESDKYLAGQQTPSGTAIRRKLVETGLKKETTSKTRCKKSPEVLSNKGLTLRDFRPVRQGIKSKSPSATKRVAKGDFSKKKDLPTDRISFLVNQFSIKKAMELEKLSLNGDFYLCRAFIALLSGVESHIKESQNFPIEVFFEYLNSPGIVVRGIKNIPEHLTNDRITNQNLLKSLEFFNMINEISTNPSLEMLAEILQTVYLFKDIPYKGLATQDTASSAQITQTPRSVENSKISVVSKRFCRTKAFKNEGFRPISLGRATSQSREDFMQSKTALLDKFFSKMGLSQDELTQRKYSPSKDVRNRSHLYLRDF